MLKEYLSTQKTPAGPWGMAMPGVQVCRFALSGPGGGLLGPIPPRGEPLHFEVFFCLSGRLAVQPLLGAPCTVEPPGLFLLSDPAALRFCRPSGDLGGILVAVDAARAKESLGAVCSALGLHLDTRTVRRKMAAEKGYLAPGNTPWTHALFETLRRLSPEAQGPYCVFKSVELLYLLCTQPSAPGNDAPAAPILQEIRAYIQAHLAEKLTIEQLCKQFSVSPTFLKEGFRRAYGTPVHSFLTQQRLQRARELICTTRLSIQQVAQAVGYEGTSQFHAAFKQCYGVTPAQYRKTSKTADSRPF